jgi:hypothetical protein
MVTFTASVTVWLLCTFALCYFFVLQLALQSLGGVVDHDSCSNSNESYINRCARVLAHVTDPLHAGVIRYTQTARAVLYVARCHLVAGFGGVV